MAAEKWLSRIFGRIDCGPNFGKIVENPDDDELIKKEITRLIQKVPDKIKEAMYIFDVKIKTIIHDCSSYEKKLNALFEHKINDFINNLIEDWDKFDHNEKNSFWKNSEKILKFEYFIFDCRVLQVLCSEFLDFQKNDLQKIFLEKMNKKQNFIYDCDEKQKEEIQFFLKKWIENL